MGFVNFGLNFKNIFLGMKIKVLQVLINKKNLFWCKIKFVFEYTNKLDENIRLYNIANTYIIYFYYLIYNSVLWLKDIWLSLHYYCITLNECILLCHRNHAPIIPIWLNKYFHKQLRKKKTSNFFPTKPRQINNLENFRDLVLRQNSGHFRFLILVLLHRFWIPDKLQQRFALCLLGRVGFWCQHTKRPNVGELLCEFVWRADLLRLGFDRLPHEHPERLSGRAARAFIALSCYSHLRGCVLSKFHRLARFLCRQRWAVVYCTSGGVFSNRWTVVRARQTCVQERKNSSPERKSGASFFILNHRIIIIFFCSWPRHSGRMK